jgi:hypothetical protein
MTVIDLDVLRPEKKVVKIGGQEIDVSFIPCGITFDIDSVMAEISGLDLEAAGAGGEETRKAFKLSIKLCSVFCSYKHPELDEEWFMSNASPQQLGALARAIQQALAQAYAGIETPQKAVKGKKG